ncbi:MAG: WbqC family protein [Bacteroidales bacterium]|nr:WbqC family protein [Bacteroidales bacterium]
MEYFALMARDMTLSPDKVIPSSVMLEGCEHYIKQTWRSRCRILTASGSEILQVPVVHTAPKMPIREVLVEYTTPWVVRTERTLDAAYRMSAYYDYYRDDIFAILEEGIPRLLDLNLALLRFLTARLGLQVEIAVTTDYAPEGTLPDDWRYALSPKKANTVLHDLGLEKPYYQVFGEKFGFTAGLSVLDLLCNEGPDAIRFLKKI